MAVLKYKGAGGTFQPLNVGTGLPVGNYVGETLVWNGSAWIAKDLIWTGTQVEYDALGTYDPDVLYVVIG